MKTKKILFILLLGSSFCNPTYAGFNFLNRLIMGNNEVTLNDGSKAPNLQPDWFISPKPNFSREDFEYLRNVLKHDFYFAEIEFQVDAQWNVLDAKLLSTNGVKFKNEEILKAARLAKLKYDFKEGTKFPFKFKSSFYFSH